MTDLAVLSSGRKPVICGVDKTFELSSCFATLVTYRQTNLVNSDSPNKQPPLFLAAVLLHYDSTEETFHNFFSQIKFRLQKANEDINVKGFQLKV